MARMPSLPLSKHNGPGPREDDGGPKEQGATPFFVGINHLRNHFRKDSIPLWTKSRCEDFFSTFRNSKRNTALLPHMGPL